jgi:hypothetical protein
MTRGVRWSGDAQVKRAPMTTGDRRDEAKVGRWWALVSRVVLSLWRQRVQDTAEPLAEIYQTAGIQAAIASSVARSRKIARRR